MIVGTFNHCTPSAAQHQATLGPVMSSAYLRQSIRYGCRRGEQTVVGCEWWFNG